jgi:hypothetical protein
VTAQVDEIGCYWDLLRNEPIDLAPQARAILENVVDVDPRVADRFFPTSPRLDRRMAADGKEEVIDFRLAQSESAAEWERFLGDLIRRGLDGDSLEMICLDGGSGHSQTVCRLTTILIGVKNTLPIRQAATAASVGRRPHAVTNPAMLSHPD